MTRYPLTPTECYRCMCRLSPDEIIGNQDRNEIERPLCDDCDRHEQRNAARDADPFPEDDE